MLTLGLSSLTLSAPATAQSSGSMPSSMCARENALGLIEQQIDATKTFGDSVQRITVLIRAADLLWLYKQKKARGTFAEAFELAAQNFKQNGDEPRRVGRAGLVETPDQRYVVIRAVARRDPAWARELTEQMLKKDREEAAEATGKKPEADMRTADKLLDNAISFLASDVNYARSFAMASLRYPATMRLTMFVYKFAEVNQREADRFYQQALAVYSDKPVREFLYLAAYPFGFNDTGDMPWMGPYSVPTAFVPNGSLQRAFVQALLRRAQQSLQLPLDESDNYNGFPGTGHILQVLTRVEPQVQEAQPDLIGAVEQVRNDLLSTLSAEHQSTFLRPEPSRDSAPKKTFDEQIEAAQKEPNVNKRDELMVTAILNAVQTEIVDHIVNTADKIADSNLRQQLLDWFYFVSAQKAIKDKRLDEAGKLASKVQELDQRAYLYSEIAKESLQRIENQNQARELLEEIVNTASNASNTVVTARTLLAAAYLYLKIDHNRAISILGDAVKSINRLDSPDFSKQSLIRKIEGRNFARYAVFKTPGFDPENAFREMGRITFDDALSQASGFTDKSLRALTTLVLADLCLQRTEQEEKADQNKKKIKP
jgi:tetratricopeptide (TPR) repeat protein